MPNDYFCENAIDYKPDEDRNKSITKHLIYHTKHYEQDTTARQTTTIAEIYLELHDFP